MVGVADVVDSIGQAINHIMKIVCQESSHKQTLNIICRLLILSPYHLIDDAHVALHNLHHLGAYILVHIIGDGEAVLTSRQSSTAVSTA